MSQEKDHMDFAQELDIALKPDSVLPGLQREVGSLLGQGIPLFSIGGGYFRAALSQILVNFHARRGYYIAETPLVSSGELFEVSGHMGYYRQNMFVFKLEDKEYAVKPMNCPFHVLIFLSELARNRTKVRLPFKIFEVGRVHRLEPGGSVYGLLRARAFTQDDAHIITLGKDAMESVLSVFDEMMTVYSKIFNVDLSPGALRLRLSLSDKSKIGTEFMGTKEEWERSEEFLRGAAERLAGKYGFEYVAAEGEAAFYGPKIDIIVKLGSGDSAKEWQLGTIQFDFNLPRRFKIYDVVRELYGDVEVYMIHRALLGSIERFLGAYLENYKGRLPFPLAPVQFAVVGIIAGDQLDEKVREVARQIHQGLLVKGFRAGYVETTRTSLSGDVRKLETGPKPAVIVYVGARELERSAITVAVFEKGSRKQLSIPARGPEEAISGLESLADELERPVVEVAGFAPRIPGDFSYEL
ncbi:MAG: aminoacyl--tRNA ligase-related protein [Acidilobus sp.]